jgi:CRISPR-associated protein Csb2
MTVLELRFPAGRFHATPWGRHVNEGAVEWPPSPWRILRSLIATRHLKARAEVPEEILHAMVTALAAQPPRYRLPDASQGHTRHYLPFNEGKHEKTTKVFDTFIQLAPNAPVQVAWDVTLATEQLAALRVLAERLGYFGRAESLVEACVGDAFQEDDDVVRPLGDGDEAPGGTELIRLLAPVSPEHYEAWQRDFMAKATAALGPRPTATQKKKLPNIPADLFAALHADTGDLQAAGWNLPPGAAHVNYARSERAFVPANHARRLSTKDLPTVARYAVMSAVLPRITQAISIGDRVHKALCSWSENSAVFTGKDDAGQPRAGHAHAHIFCEANGERDTITHLSVWASMGFAGDACTTLRRLNKVWGHGGHDVRLVLLGLGQPSEFPDCQLFGTSKVWRSATPFVSTRHGKTFRDGRPKMDETGWQIGSAAHDLLRLLALDPQTTGADISRGKAVRAGQRDLRAIQFQTIRHDGQGRRGDGDRAGFTITFGERVTGPLAIGYGAHFGLGLFIPADEPGPRHA